MLIVDDIRLIDIEDERPNQWDYKDATMARITLPASYPSVLEMQADGFLFIDRTLGVEIPATHLPASIERLKRVEVLQGIIDKERAFEIARLNFVGDSRFYITCEHDQEVAERVIHQWVDDIDEALYCEIKGEFAGFLALEQLESGNLFVKLAAVDERFRLAGAALSLYATALEIAHNQGTRKLEGRISSKNIAVANLYTQLGGRFANPKDVFLKEVTTCSTL